MGLNPDMVYPESLGNANTAAQTMDKLHRGTPTLGMVTKIPPIILTNVMRQFGNNATIPYEISGGGTADHLTGSLLTN